MEGKQDLLTGREANRLGGARLSMGLGMAGAQRAQLEVGEALASVQGRTGD